MNVSRSTYSSKPLPSSPREKMCNENIFPFDAAAALLRETRRSVDIGSRSPALVPNCHPRHPLLELSSIPEPL